MTTAAYPCQGRFYLNGLSQARKKAYRKNADMKENGVSVVVDAISRCESDVFTESF